MLLWKNGSLTLRSSHGYLRALQVAPLVAPYLAFCTKGEVARTGAFALRSSNRKAWRVADDCWHVPCSKDEQLCLTPTRR